MERQSELAYSRISECKMRKTVESRLSYVMVLADYFPGKLSHFNRSEFSRRKTRKHAFFFFFFLEAELHQKGLKLQKCNLLAVALSSSLPSQFTCFTAASSSITLKHICDWYLMQCKTIIFIMSQLGWGAAWAFMEGWWLQESSWISCTLHSVTLLVVVLDLDIENTVSFFYNK